MQLDLLEPRCKIPERGTQCYELLMAYQRGERLTVMTAMQLYGVYALSQRNGDLRNRYGWPIKSVTVETNGGARVSEYFIEL